MITERERVRRLMLQGEPVPPEDLTVARMISTDATRRWRLRAACLVVVVAALLAAVLRGLTTGHWDWLPMATLLLPTVGAARTAYLQQRARGWARRYLADAS